MVCVSYIFVLFFSPPPGAKHMLASTFIHVYMTASLNIEPESVVCSQKSPASGCIKDFYEYNNQPKGLWRKWSSNLVFIRQHSCVYKNLHKMVILLWRVCFDVWFHTQSDITGVLVVWFFFIVIIIISLRSILAELVHIIISKIPHLCLDVIHLLPVRQAPENIPFPKRQRKVFLIKDNICGLHHIIANKETKVVP